MKLTLDRLDLMPEFDHISCSRTRFHHFNEKARAAIVAAGKATFYEWERENYNAIYPPRNAPKVTARRPFDDSASGGYVESDNDFIANNHDACLWFLECMTAPDSDE